MKKNDSITSISGGLTSAYMAVNYPTKYNVFALVTTNNKSCIYPDSKIRKIVSEKIQKDFIGTLEDDKIIRTILDLEQFMGRKIDWVSGKTFDELLAEKKMLPNMFRRFCTSSLKMDPIFNYWKKNINDPVIMNIGFRANEINRAKNLLKKTNKEGLSEYKTIIGKHPSGKNKWASIAWRYPNFPLVSDAIERPEIIKYWDKKPVVFSKYNNCVGCFNAKAQKLKEQYILNPAKYNWFADKEKEIGGYFKKDVNYEKLKSVNFTMKINFSENKCSSGFCGI
jgi:hypothetical protein